MKSKANLKWIKLCCLPALLCLTGAGAPDRPEGNGATLKITFMPEFAGRPLVLGNGPYATADGDSLYLDVLRFYLSAVQLHGTTTDYAENDSYHLIDAEAPGSCSIVLENVPAGRYESLRFQVGTDSLTNVSGAMGGDLDPTLGMYWAWNSGYINVKIEGRSPSCPTRGHGFEFHIGGYRAPYPTLRQVDLPLANFRVGENESAELAVRVTLAGFFDRIRLRTTNQVMIPSAAAAGLADNFSGIFQIR